MMVPFGSRKLTGVVIEVHSNQPGGPVKQAFQLLDEEPAVAAKPDVVVAVVPATH